MTTLEISNTTSESVTAYITLGATEGCVQDVAQLMMGGGVSITRNYPLQGSFPLAAGATISMAASGTQGLNGNISINTPPLNCPTTEFPHGVNLAEFIINNSFQTGGQETIDISCVCGANAYLSFTLTASDWTTNAGTINVQTIQNGVWNDNTGRNGVFPYGCDNCTSSDNPPSCVGKQAQYANSSPICNVQRPASNNQGGMVTISYLGTIKAA
jgi:hypothetical protein